MEQEQILPEKMEKVLEFKTVMNEIIHKGKVKALRRFRIQFMELMHHLSGLRIRKLARI